MSWMHQQGSTNRNAPPPMFNPNQHSTANNQWQSTDSQNWYNPGTQQPDFWQQQQYSGQNQPHAVDQHNAPSNHFQYNQPPSQPSAFQQNVGHYDQQPYGSPPHNQLHNSYPASTQLQAQLQPQRQTEDSWNNWESWADEENLNVSSTPQQGGSHMAPPNNLGDSFSNDQTWNWSVQENEHTGGGPAQNMTGVPVQSGTVPQPPLENKILKIRGKLDTPQWSTESQPSQESSDDVLHTSESDKSHMVSRSSTISHSPISGQDFLPPTQIPKPTSLTGDVENKEIVSSSQQEVQPVPLPPRSVQTTPPVMLPPSGNAEGSSNNPYKRTTGLSHKAANTFRTSSITPPDPRQPSIPPIIPSQPINLETVPDNSEQPDHGTAKVAPRLQPWTENSEVPMNDRNQYLETGQLSQTHSLEGGDVLPPPGLQRMVPGQLEQDRSSGGTQNDRLPGFSRMVLGQTENSSGLSNQDSQIMFDPSGPPEGLHRMVPGESSSPETSMHQTQINENDSEIEIAQITSAQYAPQTRSATIGADTPPAGQTVQTVITSASPTLTSNRSETIGGDGNDGTTAQPSSVDIAHVRGASLSSSDGRGSGFVSKGAKSKDKRKPEQQGIRREFIEGQTDENDTVSGITNSIRNLTVGENPSDGQPSSGSLPDHRTRRHSRQDSSDSEEDSKLPNKLPPRDPRDKRSSEKTRSDRHKERDLDRDKQRERDSDRYSPDPYRSRRDPRKSRRRDPRYDEDDEYYSDKEKERRSRDERDRDYERKYSSLRKEKDRRRRDRDSRDVRDARDVKDYNKEPRRGGDYYHSRYGDDRAGYPEENRSSRPSSRSDSMHESYRERRHEVDPRDRRYRDKDRERERYRTREQREAFNPYQSYQYDPYSQYHQQYQYYENLRRMNPQAYAEWYRKYYQQVAAGGSNTSFTGDDRASVHSGRSSANEDIGKDRYTRQSYYSHASVSHLANYYGRSQSKTDIYGLDSSNNAALNSTTYEDQTLSNQRLTPAKFSTAHTKGSITSGKLIQILPNYPLDGQPATVEILNLQYLLANDEQYAELCSFPGPLAKGVTHKKTIIEYCDNKIRKAAYSDRISDIDSYVLMWELLILLIRQNGMVVGTDIAELLLKNRASVEPTARPPSVVSNTSSVNQTSEASNSNNPLASDDIGGSRISLKEEEVTMKFRDYLLYGSGKEALEWAMKHGLWGHALFLASKLDKRTYANVMMRFANGLAINDPLQTLYQLLSGKMPAAVTCVSDEKWGDWRPHLAMILSNSTQRPELHRKAITILGDTLLSRGNLYAAQFCYLMAEVGFNRHDNPETRLVLLGSDHRTPYPQFATNEAIHMTEIYEYACSLNDQGFVISEFQIYKYLLATRLADVGLLEKSLAYLEKVAGYIVASPQEVSSTLVDHVCNLADKLKFSDPVGDEEDESKFGGIMETCRPDNSWLKELKNVQIAFQTGQITQDTTDDYLGYQQPHQMADQDVTMQPSQSGSWEHRQYEQQYQESVVPPLDLQTERQAMESEYQGMQPQSGDFVSPYQEPHNFYPNNDQQPQHQFNQWGETHVIQDANAGNQFDPEGATAQYHVNNNNVEKPQEVPKEPPNEDLLHQSRPQISMPNQQKPKSDFNDQPLPQEKPKTEAQSPKKETKQSTGWFGGIFSKLSMKPKNQMKLPDDKNPKIVWDQEKKRWTNVDEDPNDPANEFKPPPKMADLIPKLHQQPPTMNVTGALPQGIPQEAPNFTFTNGSRMLQANGGGSGPVSLPTPAEETSGPAKPNMFKMQRGRNLKNSYVDVFNPGGSTAGTTSGPASWLGGDKMAPMQPQMNFFVPPPITDPNAPVDFLTPAPPMQPGEPISRWSSTSSLSREVDHYMRAKPTKFKTISQAHK